MNRILLKCKYLKMQEKLRNFIGMNKRKELLILIIFKLISELMRESKINHRDTY